MNNRVVPTAKADDPVEFAHSGHASESNRWLRDMFILNVFAFLTPYVN